WHGKTALGTPALGTPKTRQPTVPLRSSSLPPSRLFPCSIQRVYRRQDADFSALVTRHACTGQATTRPLVHYHSATQCPSPVARHR
ncbi:hypothetical protein HAX54_027573, partial [Datura stramonium]|nr:hypothetical protein [Datura stramonium]